MDSKFQCHDLLFVCDIVLRHASNAHIIIQICWEKLLLGNVLISFFICGYVVGQNRESANCFALAETQPVDAGTMVHCWHNKRLVVVFIFFFSAQTIQTVKRGLQQRKYPETVSVYEDKQCGWSWKAKSANHKICVAATIFGYDCESLHSLWTVSLNI